MRLEVGGKLAAAKTCTEHPDLALLNNQRHDVAHALDPVIKILDPKTSHKPNSTTSMHGVLIN